MLTLIRKKVAASTEVERLPLTANDVERLAQIANGEVEGDEVLARSALLSAVADPHNFQAPWVFAAAARLTRHFVVGEGALG